jgi:hypothetical protein
MFVVLDVEVPAEHAPESLRTNARVRMRNVDGAPTLARIRPGHRGARAGRR